MVPQVEQTTGRVTDRRSTARKRLFARGTGVYLRQRRRVFASQLARDLTEHVARGGRFFSARR